MGKNYVRKYLRWWLNMVFMHPLGTKDWLGEKNGQTHRGTWGKKEYVCVYIHE